MILSPGYAAPAMVANGDGSIFNLSSVEHHFQVGKQLSAGGSRIRTLSVPVRRTEPFRDMETVIEEENSLEM